MLAAAFALSASLAWGTGDFLAGIVARRLALLTVLLVSQVGGTFLLGLIMIVRAEHPPEVRYVAYAAFSGLVGVVGISSLYRGLAVGSMSIVAPISATGVVLPVAVGLGRGETLSVWQAAGIGVSVVGVVLAARAPSGPLRTSRIAAGTGFALLTAVASGTVLVGVDAASKSDPMWAVFVLRSTIVAILIVAGIALRPAIPGDAATIARLVLIGTLDIAGITLFAVASTRGLLSLVSVLAQTYPIVTVLLARVVLRERIGRGQRVGVLGALTGVALVTAG